MSKAAGKRAAFALALGSLCGVLSAQMAPNAPYLAFGTVVSIGQRTVEIRVDDPRPGPAIERSFLLSRETRADLVHPGEKVEVIYTVDGEGGFSLERLIALRTGVPRIGAPPARATATVASAEVPRTKPEVAPFPASASVPTPKHGRGANRRATAGSSRPKASSSRAAAAKSLPAAVPGPTAIPASRAVALGSAASAQVPSVSQIPLGGIARATTPVAPKATAIVQQPLGELCNRTQSWSSQPITLAVLDFRYPTEREESRDIAQVGGGSGTVLADEVYDQLSEDPHLALSRGDREKVFRMDFAGAARLGRQLGVDAVLLGTFVPVEPPNPDPEFPLPTQAYTLRAGVVETCTGELLYKLDSVTCGGSGGASCPGSEITAKEAANPKASSAAFALPLANLLAPVLQAGAPEEGKGTAGAITEVKGSAVTLHVAAGAPLRPGDQVGVHASRLAKIPSTNTLHVFRKELIGRVTIQRVSGGYAYGSFAGEPAPLPGDTADLLTE